MTRARNLVEANPDVLDFADVTGCNLDIDESRTEPGVRIRTVGD